MLFTNAGRKDEGRNFLWSEQTGDPSSTTQQQTREIPKCEGTGATRSPSVCGGVLWHRGESAGCCEPIIGRNCPGSNPSLAALQLWKLPSFLTPHCEISMTPLTRGLVRDEKDTSKTLDTVPTAGSPWK
jgi:hypothetical protein